MGMMREGQSTYSQTDMRAWHRYGPLLVAVVFVIASCVVLSGCTGSISAKGMPESFLGLSIGSTEDDVEAIIQKLGGVEDNDATAGVRYYEPDQGSLVADAHDSDGYTEYCFRSIVQGDQEGQLAVRCDSEGVVDNVEWSCKYNTVHNMVPPSTGIEKLRESLDTQYGESAEPEKEHAVIHPKNGKGDFRLIIAEWESPRGEHLALCSLLNNDGTASSEDADNYDLFIIQFDPNETMSVEDVAKNYEKAEAEKKAEQEAKRKAREEAKKKGSSSKGSSSSSSYSSDFDSDEGIYDDAMGKGYKGSDGYYYYENYDGSYEVTDGMGNAAVDVDGDGSIDAVTTDGGETWDEL